MSRQPLPIDAALPEIRRAVRERGALVLRAEPGAGKTTRVPPALLADLDPEARASEVWVLEPRRLAARLAARRVAAEMGEEVGGTVGYQVRFEEVASARTRLRFVTEGLLVRRLARDPLLSGVLCVVIDELHERSIHADTALALLERLRRGPRRDLRLVCMSATLDAAPVAATLGGAPVIDVQGRIFDVTIEHALTETDDPLEMRVADAVARLLDEEDARRAGRPSRLAAPLGDVLVFLPGAAEIARAEGTCRSLATRGVEVHALHGSLPPEEQDRALRPAAPGRRKVILATNVAESSVTIEGVTAVIDSGLAREAAHSPWTGLPTLKLGPVSRASAKQRAGRAGRTAPGLCVRLYTRQDHEMRPPFAAPEVRRLDLAEVVLSLAGAGAPDPAALPWLEPPPQAALEAARSLLARLGAIDAEGRLTPTGERMARIPAHPRLARLVLEGARRGVLREAALVAAALSDGDRRRSQASDVAGLLREARGLPQVARAARQIEGAARGAAGDEGERAGAGAATGTKGELSQDAAGREDALHMAILAGHPDRVAKRRETGAHEVVLCEGRTASVAREIPLDDAGFLVALDAEERPRGGALVRLAAPVAPEWLIDLFPDDVRDGVEAIWRPDLERVDVSARTTYGVLALDERRLDPASFPQEARAAAAALLAKQALTKGPRAFADADALDLLLARAAFARTLAPDLPALDDAALEDALRALCHGRRSFAELRDAGLLSAVRAKLGGDGLARLSRLAPETVPLPSGRNAKVAYHFGRPPTLATRLQDLFGAALGPRVGGGKVPLVLELLGPSGRPVQVTTDLAGFWARHYPAVRRELCRKYPRHSWPEDPTTAAPEARPRRRGT